jgi:ATPase subunit of ABC transporter with duplicated ATPase domains
MPRKKIKITLGACKFTRSFECPCSSGSVILATDGSFSKDATCSECGHLLYTHEDFEEAQNDSSKDVIVVSDSETDIKREQPISRSATAVESPTLSSIGSSAAVTIKEIKRVPLPSDAQIATQPSRPYPTRNIAPVTREEQLGFTCPRQSTITRIARGLKKNRALLICGGYSTGKTTLARLLEKYMEDEGKVAIYVGNMYTPG